MKSLLTQCERGEAMTVILEGGAGCGKTNLMESFAQHAAESGAVVLAAFDVVGCPAASWTGDVVRRSSPESQEFGDRLEELAERSTVVVCLDDPQCRKELVWHWLLGALRRLRNSRVMLVSTLLPFGGSAGSDLHCELLRQPNVHRIRLRPLDRRGTVGLWESVCDSSGDGGVCDGLYAASGGNPLLVRALYEERCMRGGSEPAPPFPSPGGLFAKAAVDCVLCSGTLAESVAVGMAALREFSSPENLAAVLDLDAAEVARGQTLLLSAGLVDAGRLRHPVIESAVLEHLEPVRRSEVLLHAAALLRERGAEALVTAHYLLEVGEVAEPWQLVVLQRAADEALGADDAHTAEACLALAYDASSDCWKRARLMLKRLAVTMRTDPWGAEQHFLGKLEQTTCRHGAEGCLARSALTAGLLIGCGRLDEAGAILRSLPPQALNSLVDGCCPETSYGGWSWLSCFAPGLPDAWALPFAADGFAGGAGQHRGGDENLTSVVERGIRMDLRHVRLREAEERLRTSVLGDTTLTLILPELTRLVSAGRPDLADAWCEHFLREAVDRRVEGWRQLLTAMRAEIALARGRLTDAESLAREVVDLGGRVPGCWLYGGPLTVLITVCAATGRFEEAARLLDRPLPEGFFLSVHGLDYLRARGQFLLAVNRPQLALSDFLTIGWRADQWKLPVTAQSRWRIDAAEAWLRLGNDYEAGQLLAAHESVMDTEDARGFGMWLRARARLADVSERPGLLSRSAERFQASGDMWELAKALADLTEAYQEVGQSARADLTLRKARQLVDGCGAGPLGEQLASLAHGGLKARRSVRGPVGVPDPAVKLSDSERRVAVLAARGLTNKEISIELFITVSTVEQHLTRVYKKLDITSRQELLLHIESALPKQPEGCGNGATRSPRPIPH